MITFSESAQKLLGGKNKEPAIETDDRLRDEMMEAVRRLNADPNNPKLFKEYTAAFGAWKASTEATIASIREHRAAINAAAEGLNRRKR